MVWHSGQQWMIEDAHVDDEATADDTGTPTEDSGQEADTGADFDADTDEGSADDGDVPDEGGDGPASEGDNSPAATSTVKDAPSLIVGSDAKLTTGCNAAPGYPALPWLVSLLGLARMRSRQCENSQSS